ncbi:probable ATP-dependent DNA helicase HFM1 [Ptychodera flava]|uniref:probable ATP-dependent DNA helicase HFM1 n=1 Tax=Ptychodera flava TaxID=63121 RepID=UPI003969F51A
MAASMEPCSLFKLVGFWYKLKQITMLDISDSIFFDPYHEEKVERPAMRIALHNSPDLLRPPPSADDLILPSQRSVTGTQIDRIFDDAVTKSPDNFLRPGSPPSVFPMKKQYLEHGSPPLLLKKQFLEHGSPPLLFDDEGDFPGKSRDSLRKQLFPDPEDTIPTLSQQPKVNNSMKRRRLFRPPIKSNSQQPVNTSTGNTTSVSASDHTQYNSSQMSARFTAADTPRTVSQQKYDGRYQQMSNFQTSNRLRQDLESSDFHAGSQQSRFSTMGNAATTRAVSDSPSPLTIPGYVTPGGSRHDVTKLRPITEVPEKYRSIFSAYPYFNIVQSKVMDDVLYSDRPMVLCAPTGSGKTVIFELAIVRLLLQSGTYSMNQVKIVYMAPIKALCSERCDDWQQKFGPVGLKCKELTGDSEWDDYFELQDTNIIMTTPEKWDSMTRKWRDNKSLVQMVKLFLIDEVHTLNDEARGATMEAVISRMKTIQSAQSQTDNPLTVKSSKLRFLAISATIPNIGDVGEWLGDSSEAAFTYKLDDTHRPVRLRKVVLGFPCRENVSEFKFDLSLNYKLSGVIQTYSDQKPTLVFCATRKGVQQAASTLVKDARFIMNSQHRQRLQRNSNMLRDSKLRELVISGVGYHHAGLDVSDRKAIENMFLQGDLPVLLATSTLAMGVNLPAHLVIVKSTLHYVSGMYTEYTETQVLQMIGRAGRPQFDTTATAVIMTRTKTKNKYEALLNGTQNIESSLHVHIMEHLNAEIVLHTITDMNIALEWLKSTFLYIRVVKNPTYYGIPPGLTKEALEKRLTDMCCKYLQSLKEIDLVKTEEDKSKLQPTELGKLMARYCIAYDTMKLFKTIDGQSSLNELIVLLSKCKEFSDVQLRVNEKRALNTLNSSKNKATIRFSMTGKIKTADMKVNCLIQAALGCLSVQEFALAQDTTKIFRAGQRVTRCLTEYLMQQKDFRALVNAVTLSKCFKARLWENSGYVARQLERVGPTLTQAMVNAGLTTFKRIEETNPREIELIVNRHPPFGNQIHDAVCHLPQYDVVVTQSTKYSSESSDITVSVFLVNWETIKVKNTAGPNHCCVLIVGDADNKIHYKMRISDTIMCKNGTWSKRIEVQRARKGDELSIHLISQDIVGLDVQKTFNPIYNRRYGMNFSEQQRTQWKTEPSESCTNKPSGQDSGSDTIPCNHRCMNKSVCGHDCCQYGVKSIRNRNKPVKAVEPHKDPAFNCYISQLHAKLQHIPGTPSLKRLKVSPSEDKCKTPEIQTYNSPYFAESAAYDSKAYTQNSVVPKYCEEDWLEEDVLFDTTFSPVDDHIGNDWSSNSKHTFLPKVVDVCKENYSHPKGNVDYEEDWGQDDDDDFLLDYSMAAVLQEDSLNSTSNHTLVNYDMQDDVDFENHCNPTQPYSALGQYHPTDQRSESHSYCAPPYISSQFAKNATPRRTDMQNQELYEIGKSVTFQKSPQKMNQNFQFKRKYGFHDSEKENCTMNMNKQKTTNTSDENLSSVMRQVQDPTQSKISQYNEQPEKMLADSDGNGTVKTVVSGLRNKYSFHKAGNMKKQYEKSLTSHTMNRTEQKGITDYSDKPTVVSPELCVQEVPVETCQRKGNEKKSSVQRQEDGFGNSLCTMSSVDSPPLMKSHPQSTGMNFFTCGPSKDTCGTNASREFLNIFDGIF